MEANQTKTDPSIVDVTLEPIKESLNGELSKDFYYECAFCQKTVKPVSGFHTIYETLTGDYFHCPFCIRHGYHTRNNKHILIMSFRAVIGYYYYAHYLSSYDTKIWLTEIKEIIESHIQTGLLNPLFTYDPESLLWFVDFSKVGRGKKKIPISDILKTISNILVCFNLCKYEPNCKPQALYQKYEEAILKWYQNRTRPEGKRFLIPTLIGCGIYSSTHANSFSVEDTKNFVLRDLLMRK
jgi:hypothetical protein